MTSVSSLSVAQQLSTEKNKNKFSIVISLNTARKIEDTFKKERLRKRIEAAEQSETPNKNSKTQLAKRM